MRCQTTVCWDWHVAQVFATSQRRMRSAIWQLTDTYPFATEPQRPWASYSRLARFFMQSLACPC